MRQKHSKAKSKCGAASLNGSSVWLCAMMCPGCGPPHGLAVINATSSRVECEVALGHRPYTIGGPHLNYRFELSPGERWSSRSAPKLDRVDWHSAPIMGQTTLLIGRGLESGPPTKWVINDQHPFEGRWPVVRIIGSAVAPDVALRVEQLNVHGTFAAIYPVKAASDAR